MRISIVYLYKVVLLSLLMIGWSLESEARELAGKHNNSSNPYRKSYQRMSSKYSHTMELRGDILWSWGDNSNGQLGLGSNTPTMFTSPQQVPGNQWVNVSTGRSHTLALKSNGTIYACGSNANGELGQGNTNLGYYSFTQVGVDNKWVGISAGDKFSIGIKSDGTIWGWGYNSSNQLGIGNSVDQNVPIQIGTANDWVTISAGAQQVYGIKSNGTLWGWGSNGSGAIGNGIGPDQPSPIQIGTDTKWLAVSGGSDYVLAIKTDGTLWAWGSNNHGQLGNNSTVNQAIPAQIGSNANWTTVSASGDPSYTNSHAINANGALWSWGDNTLGQLGLGITGGAILIPTQISTAGNANVEVESGASHFEVLKANGGLWACGRNAQGQLGDGSNINKNTLILTTMLSNKWICVSEGMGSTYAIRSDGTLWAWGDNSYGQLGLGFTSPSSSIPVQVGTDNTWVSVAAGGEFAVGLKADGGLYCWGRNNNGQASWNYPSNVLSPINVGIDYVSIAAGTTHGFGIKSNGTLWGWGHNASGALGLNNLINQTSGPVQIGTDIKWIGITGGHQYTVALKSDGTLWSTGDNFYGQLGVGNNVDHNLLTQVGTDNKWVSISAGFKHTLSLKSDGTFWSWGSSIGLSTYNVPSQVGSLNTWVNAVAGNLHTFAKKSDGHLWVCGTNSNGQLGNNNNTNQSTFIDLVLYSGAVELFSGARGDHSALIKANRDMICLTGWNASGQLGDGTNIDINHFNCISVCTQITPTCSISANPAGTVCIGTNVQFTASITNGGTSPTYQWYKNGNPVGTDQSTYNDNALNNADVISCVLTSNASCANSSVVVSNAITVSVTPSVIPTINITANLGNNICSSTSVTFTAAITNGGTIPVYQWKKNGVNVGANSNSYTSNTLNNNDIITCELTSNATCVSTPIVTSNSITMVVTSPVTPTISITANPGNTICIGASVTFTATITNGGTTPVYQWKKNGVNVGTNSNSYTSSTLSNNDIITCDLTSNAACASINTITSNSITITVSSSITPAVSISLTPNDTICAGASVTFTAAAVNGGTTPTYQWKKNGLNVGTNSTTYTNSTLINGDVINCTLTSNLSCVTSATANSNNITMTVNANVTPTINITANPGSTICSGVSVTFTATISNGGTTPSYQWKKNGVNVGVNSATYTSTALVNSDAITCELTSNASCLTSSIAISNTINMIVNPLLTPTVSISSNAGDTICTGTSVTYTANISNGGTTPTYQWKKNGVNVGTNSSTYIDNTINNGDIIVCSLTSNESCLAVTTIASNDITMVVSNILVPTVSIIVNPSNTICAGENVVFTATATSCGNSPGYQWQLNSLDIAGANSWTYNTTALANGDILSCIVTSNASCTSVPTDTSNIITMTVNPVTVPSVSISANPGTIVSQGQSVTFTATVTNGGTTPTYQWFLNGTSIAGATNSAYNTNTLADNDQISVEIASSDLCSQPSIATSNVLTISVTNSVNSVMKVSNWIQLYPNPNSGIFTLSGLFRSITDKVYIEIIDVAGRIVYKKEYQVNSDKLMQQVTIGEEIAQGMYTVKIVSNNEVDVIQFVKR